MAGQNVNSPPRITYKTLKELQEEYTKLDLTLNDKVKDNEITFGQCIITKKALSELYYEYKNNAIIREQQSKQNSSPQENSSTFSNSDEENHNKIIDEQIKPFEKLRDELREKYGYYESMTPDEQEKFDMDIENLFEKIKFRKKLVDSGIDVDKIDDFEELVKKEIGIIVYPESIERSSYIR